jgi:hypothetical protein
MDVAVSVIAVRPEQTMYAPVRHSAKPCAFLAIGASIVDFVLTIAIGAAAVASAVIAYLTDLSCLRLSVALVMVAGVGTWFGHWGRTVFASMTAAFVSCGCDPDGQRHPRGHC